MPNINDISPDHLLNQLREAARDRGFFSKDSKALVIREGQSGASTVERRGSHFWVQNGNVGREENHALRKKFYNSICTEYGEAIAYELKRGLLGSLNQNGNNLSAKEVRQALARADHLKAIAGLDDSEFLKTLEESTRDRGVLSKDSKAIVIKTPLGKEAVVRRRGSFFWMPNFNVGKEENAALRNKFYLAIFHEYGEKVAGGLHETLRGDRRKWRTDNLSAAEVRDIFMQARCLRSIYEYPKERLLGDLTRLAGLEKSGAISLEACPPHSPGLLTLQEDGNIGLAENTEKPLGPNEFRALRLQFFEAISSKYGGIIANNLKKDLIGTGYTCKTDNLSVAEVRDICNQAEKLRFIYECSAEQLYENLIHLIEEGGDSASSAQEKRIFIIKRDGSIALANDPERSFSPLERQVIRSQVLDVIRIRYGESMAMEFNAVKFFDGKTGVSVEDVRFLKKITVMAPSSGNELLECLEKVDRKSENTALILKLDKQGGISTEVFIPSQGEEDELQGLENRALRRSLLEAIKGKYGAGVALCLEGSIIGSKKESQEKLHVEDLIGILDKVPSVQKILEDKEIYAGLRGISLGENGPKQSQFMLNERGVLTYRETLMPLDPEESRAIRVALAEAISLQHEGLVSDLVRGLVVGFRSEVESFPHTKESLDKIFESIKAAQSYVDAVRDRHQGAPPEDTHVLCSAITIEEASELYEAGHDIREFPKSAYFRMGQEERKRLDEEMNGKWAKRNFHPPAYEEINSKANAVDELMPKTRDIFLSEKFKGFIGKSQGELREDDFYKSIENVLSNTVTDANRMYMKIGEKVAMDNLNHKPEGTILHEIAQDIEALYGDDYQKSAPAIRDCFSLPFHQGVAAIYIKVFLGKMCSMPNITNCNVSKEPGTDSLIFEWYVKEGERDTMVFLEDRQFNYGENGGKVNETITYGGLKIKYTPPSSPELKGTFTTLDGYNYYWLKTNSEEQCGGKLC